MSKTTSLKGQLKNLLMSAALIFGFLFSTTASAQTVPAGVKNIVLVHGAFADGSGWRALYEVLSKKGYKVTIVQNPLSSLEDDVAATKVVLDNQDGPTVLVGHSWGGAVITEAGNHPNVVALVYVAAFQPDNGDLYCNGCKLRLLPLKMEYWLLMQKESFIMTRLNTMQVFVPT